MTQLSSLASTDTAASLHGVAEMILDSKYGRNAVIRDEVRRLLAMASEYEDNATESATPDEIEEFAR